MSAVVGLKTTARRIWSGTVGVAACTRRAPRKIEAQGRPESCRISPISDRPTWRCSSKVRAWSDGLAPKSIARSSKAGGYPGRSSWRQG